MKIEIQKDGTSLTIIPDGRLDTSTSPVLKKTVEENITDVTDLTFDLKKLGYLSSAGLRVLMMAQKTLQKQGKMRLINVSEDIIDIMDMVRLTDIFTIE